MLGFVSLPIPKADGVESSTFGIVNNSEGPISFTINGAKMLPRNISDSNNNDSVIKSYNVLVPSNSTISLSATARSSPNMNASGVSFYFGLRYADVSKEIYTNKTSTTLSTDISTIRQKVNNTFISPIRISYSVTGCPSRGCPKIIYSTTIVSINIYLVPKLTINSNVTETVTIPARSPKHDTLYNYTMVKLFGKFLPIDIGSHIPSIKVYINGVADVRREGMAPSTTSDGSYYFIQALDPSDMEMNGSFKPGNYTFVVSVTSSGSNFYPDQLISSASLSIIVKVSNYTTSSTTTTSTTVLANKTVDTNQQFTGIVNDALGRPLRGVQVQLFWSSAKSNDVRLFAPLSDVYYTDYLGNFLIRGQNINSSMSGWGFVQVTLQTDYFVVKDNTSAVASPTDLQAAKYDYPNPFFTVKSKSDLNQNIMLLSSQAPAWAKTDLTLGNYLHASSLGVVYVNTFNAINFYSDNLNFHGYRKSLPVVAFAGKTFFRASESAPFISISTYNSERLNDIPNREYHEFAHYIMFLAFGGEKYFSSNHPGMNHDGYMNPNSKDSLIEGFAEFFAQATFNYAHNITNPNNYDAWYQIDDNYKWNLNNAEPVNRTVNILGTSYYRRNSEENAVAGILWALHSPTDNTDGKTTELNINSIWSIVTGTYTLCQNVYASPATCRQTSERQIETLSDLFTVIATPDKIQKYGINLNQTVKIALAFKVLEVQPDTIVQTGVSNPSGGPNPSDAVRLDRRDVEHPPYDAIIVKSNPQSIPYLLTIKISYAPPYVGEDTSITANITQSEQSIYLWLPSSKLYSTTATLVASKDGYQTITLTSFNNTFYDNNPRSDESLITTPIVSLQALSIQSPSLSTPFQITSLTPFVIAGVILLLVFVGILKVIRKKPAQSKQLDQS